MRSGISSLQRAQRLLARFRSKKSRKPASCKESLDQPRAQRVVVNDENALLVLGA